MAAQKPSRESVVLISVLLLAFRLTAMASPSSDSAAAKKQTLRNFLIDYLAKNRQQIGEDRDEGFVPNEDEIKDLYGDFTSSSAAATYDGASNLRPNRHHRLPDRRLQPLLIPRKEILPLVSYKRNDAREEFDKASKLLILRKLIEASMSSGGGDASDKKTNRMFVGKRQHHQPRPWMQSGDSWGTGSLQRLYDPNLPEYLYYLCAVWGDC